MPSFIEAFGAVVNGEPFGNRSQFAAAADVSTSYLTDIFKGKKVPKPETLEEWLRRAKVDEATSARLLFLCRLEKVREYPDLVPLFDHLTRQRRAAADALRMVVAACHQRGVQLPAELTKAINALDFTDE